MNIEVHDEHVYSLNICTCSLSRARDKKETSICVTVCELSTTSNWILRRVVLSRAVIFHVNSSFPPYPSELHLRPIDNEITFSTFFMYASIIHEKYYSLGEKREYKRKIERQ